jgi:hypothetical protein
VWHATLATLAALARLARARWHGGHGRRDTPTEIETRRFQTQINLSQIVV